MREVEGERHEILSLVDGITKHHTLVAGPLIDTLSAAHTSVDVATLFMYGGEDAEGVAVETVGAAVIAYLLYDFAHGVGHIHICLTAHLACHHHLTGGAECLYGHMAFRVACEKFVKQYVADLVGHLVGMAFRY